MGRLQMVFAAERTMRLMLTARVESEHPEWTPEQITRGIAQRRLAANEISLDELPKPVNPEEELRQQLWVAEARWQRSADSC